MGIAAIFGTAFGVVGIGFVILTFGANRRSADAARDANRPWIEGFPTEPSLQFGPEKGFMDVDITFKNHGNSPATNVFAAIKFLALEKSTKREPSIAVPLMETILDRMEGRSRPRGTTVFPESGEKQFAEDSFAIAEIPKAEKLRFLLVVGISYRFGGEKGRTIKTFHVTFQGGVELGRSNLTTLLTSANLTLTDCFEGYAR